jgi:hypothetical protein
VKESPKMWPKTFFCQTICISFTVEKSYSKIWAISVIFIKLPKVNNDPIGANSPNLVTLDAARAFRLSYIDAEFL